MTSASKYANEYMLIVFFFYGLAFFFLGTAILLKHDKRSALRLQPLLLLLAGFGLLHGASEWSDMFLALGEAYWTPFLFRLIKITGFYLGLCSFVFLLVFGAKLVALDRARSRWLEHTSLCVSVLFVIAVSMHGMWTGMSNQWYVTGCVLTRYLLALPASLLVAAGLFRQSQSREIKEIGSSTMVLNIRGLAIVFAAYAILAGVVVPKAPFPLATFINYSSFESSVGVPVQIVRAACALLAAWFVSGILNTFSAVSYKELENQIQERTGDLANVNETLRTDIEARKRLEAELVHSRDAALESSRVKADFLANMSHEIRTPMNGVIGMAELVLDTELGAEQREHLEILKASAVSLLDIVNEILDFSKIEAGKLELEVVDFNLRDNLETTTKGLSVAAHAKGLVITCGLGPDVPEVIAADPTRLRQVLVNLISNAVKFTARGEVSVMVALDSRAGAHFTLHFTVRDTGPGIAAEKQKSIFAAFSQADNSTTRRFGGTGLGLTICSRLVELMGGKIWVESQLGNGSTFHFTAQATLGHDRSAESRHVAIQRVLGTIETSGNRSLPPTSLRKPGPGMRILLAEDNKVNQLVASRMLERNGHRVTMAVTGHEVLSAMEREDFDLVLMDLQMPEMGGLEATAAIREMEQSSGKHIPIIAMTASAMRGDQEKCLEAGMDDYISKPIRAEEFIKVVVKHASAKSQP